MTTRELIELEERGWQALSAGPQAATEFYESVLDDDVVMLLPGGLRLDDRAAIIASMGGPPWASHRLEEPRVLPLTADTAVVIYGVVAERSGSPPYSALISSTYVRRGDGWKLAIHQQTPR
jgi:Domain of unknown function (DUF4440)